jgi:hypothetical protein
MPESTESAGPSHPWFGRGSLRLWLAASVVMTVLAVVSTGELLDYRREHREHFREIFGSLEEEAQVLMTARMRMTQPEAFALYVDDFCARMNEFVSPGHHILVLDGSGKVIVRTRHHSGPEVGEALLAADPGQKVIKTGEHRLAQVRLTDADGTTIVVAQYLDHMERVLREQLLSRAVTAAATGVLLIVLIFLAIQVWVLRPLARLTAAGKVWAGRDFSARIRPSGPSDLRRLTCDFNVMAERLDAYERNRLAEMEQARQIQAKLLPRSLPRVSNLTFAAAYRPAVFVAGDLYDVFQLPSGRTAAAVLDVAGHGVSAALLTGVVKMALLRRLSEREEPAQAMTAVNRDLLACGRFVTACVGVWDPKAFTWTYASAGHPGGLFLSDGRARPLDVAGPPLGVFETETWEQRSITMDAGRRLFLYTDGVVDAGAPDNPLGTTGLIRILESASDRTLQQQVAAVIEEVDVRSADGLLDDATLLALEVLPGPVS